MKKAMIVCAVVSLFAASGAVWAKDGGGPGGPEHRGGMRGFGQGPGGVGWLVHNEEAAKKIGVTDDQLNQLREMEYQGEIAQIKCRADLEIAQMELRRLMDNPKTTEEVVGKAIDKISSLEAQMQKMRMGEMLKARAILGEETMGKLRDAMKERMRERGPRGDRHGDRRGMCERNDDQAPAGPPPRPEDDDDND